jgi:hypothetical protein
VRVGQFLLSLLKLLLDLFDLLVGGVLAASAFVSDRMGVNVDEAGDLKCGVFLEVVWVE